MTKKELFFSATILVVFQLIATVLQQLTGGVSGPLGVAFFYLSASSEWCGLISQLAFQVTDHLWIGAFAEALMPYLFVLFGQTGTNQGPAE